MQWGTSYYPEITPPDQWEADLAQMARAGLTLLRLGEFAWSAMEPTEGGYDWAWLDGFLSLAHGRGMQVILCTPTATPPTWLTRQYPEVMIERRDGSRHVPGGRRDVDVDSEVFQFYSVQIAEAMGRRYGRHPAVIGWQIDNELIGPEGEPPESHGPATRFRFRQYLKEVHGDLATLNHRWTTRFWSQSYSDWSQIDTPRNPRTTMGQVLDYSRYFSGSIRRYLSLQYAALRTVVDPSQWISHNSTAVFDRGLDHMDWAGVLDEAGWDAYPGAAGSGHANANAAMAHDMFRAAKHRRFMVFETSAIDRSFTRAFAAEMVARGARAIVFWHWRNHPGNAENMSDTFCDHAGRPDPARVAFLRSMQACEDLNEPMPDTLEPRPAALLFNPDCVRMTLTPDPYMRSNLDGQVTYL